MPPRVLPSPLDVVARFAALIAEPFGGNDLLGHAAASLQRWPDRRRSPRSRRPAARRRCSPGCRRCARCSRRCSSCCATSRRSPGCRSPCSGSARRRMTQASIVFIAAFPACVINTQLGVSQVDPILVRAARTLGAGSCDDAAARSCCRSPRRRLHRPAHRLQQRLDGAGRRRARRRQAGPRLPDLAGPDQRLGRDHLRRHHRDRRARRADRPRPAARCSACCCPGRPPACSRSNDRTQIQTPAAADACRAPSAAAEDGAARRLEDVPRARRRGRGARAAATSRSTRASSSPSSAPRAAANRR